MSGGRFMYADERARNEIFGYDYDKPTNVFEDWEISELVWDVFNLIHDFDWYASGDTCKETYLKQKAAFKKKWFQNNRKDRIKRIIEESLSETKRELFETFGLEFEDGNEHKKM